MGYKTPPFFHLLLLITISGCASLSNREKTLITMAGSAAAGGAVGYVTTPSGTNPVGHSALWSGVSAAAGGVVGLFIFDEKRRADELERQNLSMKKEIDAFREEASGSQPELVSEQSASSGKDVPTDVQGLVKRGKWQLFRLNQWKSTGENTMVHEDKMFKLIPPSLNPGGINKPFEEGK